MSISRRVGGKMWCLHILEFNAALSVNRVHVHITTWRAKERCRFLWELRGKGQFITYTLERGKVKNRIKYKTQYHLHAF